MLFFINRQIKVIIAALFSFFNVSVIVLITKRLIGSSRPIFMPEIEKSLHFVNGITHECDMSFPSGHASTIFTMVCIVCLLKPTKGFLFHFCLIITAILVAYSRVYLCHHFYKDIYFGAILGTVITITTFCLFTCCCKDSFYK